MKHYGMNAFMGAIMGIAAVLGSLPARTATAEPAPAESGLAAVFPDGLLDGKGQAVALDTLGDKVIGLYFSAQWCGPCRAFTPVLVKYHEANGADFEVVFVSSDRSEEAQLAYMQEAAMPWLTLKWNSPAANALKKRFEITGIPTLVLLRANGEPLTREGRRLVTEGTPAAKLRTARVETETFMCDQCDKPHTRETLVYAD